MGSKRLSSDEGRRREMFGDFGHKEIGSGRVQVIQVDAD